MRGQVAHRIEDRDREERNDRPQPLFAEPEQQVQVARRRRVGDVRDVAGRGHQQVVNGRQLLEPAGRRRARLHAAGRRRIDMVDHDRHEPPAHRPQHPRSQRQPHRGELRAHARAHLPPGDRDLLRRAGRAGRVGEEDDGFAGQQVLLSGGGPLHIRGIVGVRGDRH